MSGSSGSPRPARRAAEGLTAQPSYCPAAHSSPGQQSCAGPVPALQGACTQICFHPASLCPGEQVPQHSLRLPSAAHKIQCTLPRGTGSRDRAGRAALPLHDHHARPARSCYSHCKARALSCNCSEFLCTSTRLAVRRLRLPGCERCGALSCTQQHCPTSPALPTAPPSAPQLPACLPR